MKRNTSSMLWMSRWLVALSLGIGVGSYFQGCATNPVTGRNELQLVPTSQEISIGSQNYTAYQQQEGGPLLQHAEINEYVRRVGQKLAAVSDRPSLPYEFVVLNNSVPNAWALPGGKIALNRGLLVELKSEAEMAAVLAHEIVHAAARHGAQSMERGILMQTGVIALGLAVSDHDYSDVIMLGAGLTAGLVGQKYSRSAESDADFYGMKYMHKAGYDTMAAVELQQTFVNLSKGKGGGWLDGLFASHPPSQQRVDANQRTLAKYPAGGFRGEEEYRRIMAPLHAEKEAYEKIGKGYQELKRNQHASALRHADEALTIAPREALAHGLAAKALVGMNRKPQALDRLDKAIAMHPEYFEFYRMRGLLRRDVGRAGYESDLQQSQRLLPTASAAHALGMISQEKGNHRAAQAYFAMASHGNSAEAHSARSKLDTTSSPSSSASRAEDGISLKVATDQRGYLAIVVANQGRQAVRNLRVNVVDNRNGSSRPLALTSRVEPGSASSFVTRIGPFPSAQVAQKHITLHLDSLEISP